MGHAYIHFVSFMEIGLFLYHRESYMDNTNNATISACYSTFTDSLKNGGERLPPWDYIAMALPKALPVLKLFIMPLMPRYRYRLLCFLQGTAAVPPHTLIHYTGRFSDYFQILLLQVGLRYCTSVVLKVIELSFACIIQS